MREFGLTIGSAWLAGLAMAARWAILLCAARTERSARALRVATTMAAVCLTLHLICAFHFVHDWSQLEAKEHIARVTARATGIKWGGGVWFNYATLGLLWFEAARPSRRRAWPRGKADLAGLVIEGWLVFMFFNAMVVFAATPARWGGAALFVALAVAACAAGIRQYSRHSSPPTSTK
jgi:hypothetical protein